MAMLATIRQYLRGIGDGKAREALRAILEPIGDRISSQALTSAGLAINAASSAIVKAGSAFYYAARGRINTVAANTQMAALVGTVTNAKYNLYAFFVDPAGNLTSQMGVEAASLNLVRFPPVPEGCAVIGFVIIHPTGTGNFVGGTTALDDATVVPNAAYINVVGGFDPSVTL